MGLGCPSLLESKYLVNSDMDYKMADMNFLLHCVDWIRNLSDRQHIFVDIHVGDFKFVFDNKDPARKNRTPSQLKRNYVKISNPALVFVSKRMKLLIISLKLKMTFKIRRLNMI